MPVKPIPDGYNAVCPYLVVSDAARLLDFLKKTFEAQEIMRLEAPGGTIGHAEVRIGDSVIMMGDATPQAPPTAAMIHVYVPDVDAAYRRALQAGATASREVADMFYGDRAGEVKDAFGNRWYISTHKEDLTPEEIGRRAAAAMQGKK
jgi:PhnB protein